MIDASDNKEVVNWRLYVVDKRDMRLLNVSAFEYNKSRKEH